MERRKDSKGKVLKEGESERKNNTYQYRWTDRAGKRHTVYAGTLKELREKELKVQDSIREGLNYEAGRLTVFELVKRHQDISSAAWGVRTIERNRQYLNKLKRDPIGSRLVSDIAVSDAKLWAKNLYETGVIYSTVNDYKAVLSSAFQTAYEDGIISRNPFGFKLSKVIHAEHKEKTVITEEQYKRLLAFMSGNGFYRKRMDEIIILYETGIRVSELCGLTRDDVDLQKNILKIDHQMYRTVNGDKMILKPKSRAGNRLIPLTPQAAAAFARLIEKVEKENNVVAVDGKTGFLFPGRYGTVRTASDMRSFMASLIYSYNKKNAKEPLPHITAHTFRHTFCSRLLQQGINLKAVQYFMGHSTSKMTLEVYGHVFKDESIEEFMRAFGEKSRSSDTPITTPISQNLCGRM